MLNKGCGKCAERHIKMGECQQCASELCNGAMAIFQSRFAFWLVPIVGKNLFLFSIFFKFSGHANRRAQPAHSIQWRLRMD